MSTTPPSPRAGFSARTYFVQTVLPAFLEMTASLRWRVIGEGMHLRKVAAAADALLNLPDHLYREEPALPLLGQFKDIRAYRESHWPSSPAYELTCDIANAFKHRRVTREGRLINSVYDVTESFAQCRYKDAEGEYSYVMPYILAKTLDGKVCFVPRAIYSAMRYWNKELARLDVIPKEFELLYSEHVMRHDPSMTSELQLQGTVGEHVALQLSRMSYNYETHCLEPSFDTLAGEGSLAITAQVKKGHFE